MAARTLVAGLDIGTTGVKAMIADTEGNVVGLAYREYPCAYPAPGWVEQDVELMWSSICEASRELIAKSGVDPRSLKSLGISSQRGTFIPVDKKLSPLMNSIVWSDGRADRELKWIEKEIGAESYHRTTGVPISGMWSYPKMKWYIDNKKALLEKTHRILNGQEYFLYKLGAEELSTDPASITLNGMMDIGKLDWSAELCAKIGLPIGMLPKMGTPARAVGKVSRQAAEQTGFAEGMPISIGAGDQQCAAIGAGIVREGMAEITIGTAMVMVAHIDSRKPDPKRTVLIGGSGIPHKWDMEGLTFTAGSALRWYRDTFAGEEISAARSLGLDPYDLITLEASKSSPGSKGLLFHPFFQGQITPSYTDGARGAMMGLSFVHDRKDIARAILEGVAFETKMVIGAMEDVLGRPFDVLRLSGGGSKSPLWNQIQADIYGRTVERLKVSECTTLGATILGAAGCGVFPSVEDGVKRMVHPLDTVEPNPRTQELYREQLEVYRYAFQVARDNEVYGRMNAHQKKYWS